MNIPDLTPTDCPEPLLTVAQMTAVDAAAVAGGIGIDVLMQAAGEAVARVATNGLEGLRRIAVLCGPGNNGGDGYVAARLLAAQGHDVSIFHDGQPGPGTAAARAVALWQGENEPLDAFHPDHWELVGDALYGAGLARPLTGAAARTAENMNAGTTPCLAVDVPSGLAGDTGLAEGPVLKAACTVTFFRRKPGHLLWPGRLYCGRTVVADIGLTARHLATVAEPDLWRNSPALWKAARPIAALDAHKYQRGHVLAVSGPALQTGAARLSAQAALNAGAGAVTLAGTREALLVHAAHVSAIMLAEAATPDALAGLLQARHFNAALVGPAATIGEETRQRIVALRKASLPLVLDADALTSLSGHLTLLADHGTAVPCVLTPHAGEFERLFGAELGRDTIFSALSPGPRQSKVEQARAAARLSGCILVFKGVDTVIAAPDGRAVIDDTGGPELATAGSGDVLAGLVAAHLAGGMAGFEAACAAVWLHGICGRSFGPGLTAERLVTAIRPVEAWI